jgi:peptidoglycan hydrolase CwlO-like protein
MKTKNAADLISDPTMLDKAKAGVSFNNDDRQFLERQYNGLLEYLKDKLTENQKFLAEILIDNNSSVNSKIDAIMAATLEIKRDVKELRLEIKEIKIEVKELKVDIKSINSDLLIIHRQLIDHQLRLEGLECKKNMKL